MKEDLFIAKTYCQMKTRNAMITSFILSFLTIWITASIIEAGDVNAISMYFAVFLGPIVLVLLLNAIVLAMAKSARSLAIKRWLTAVPLFVLIVLAFPFDTTMPGVDGSLSFWVWWPLASLMLFRTLKLRKDRNRLKEEQQKKKKKGFQEVNSV